jgi:hypothetical protein
MLSTGIGNPQTPFFSKIAVMSKHSSDVLTNMFPTYPRAIVNVYFSRLSISVHPISLAGLKSSITES